VEGVLAGNEPLVLGEGPAARAAVVHAVADPRDRGRMGGRKRRGHGDRRISTIVPDFSSSVRISATDALGELVLFNQVTKKRVLSLGAGEVEPVLDGAARSAPAAFPRGSPRLSRRGTAPPRATGKPPRAANVRHPLRSQLTLRSATRRQCSNACDAVLSALAGTHGSAARTSCNKVHPAMP
jgi:hypothetical protein